MRERLIKRTLLHGPAQALDHNIATQQQYDNAREFLSELPIYGKMQLGFFCVSRASDILSSPLYYHAAQAETNQERWFALAVAAHQQGPNFVRAGLSYGVGKITDRDWSVMAKTATVPIVGGYVAIPTQIAHEFTGNEQADFIRTMNRRALFVRMSHIIAPGNGGWDTQAEQRAEELYNQALVQASNIGKYSVFSPI